MVIGRKLNKLKVIVYALGFGLIFCKSALGQDSLRKYFPEDIRLGMDLSEFSSHRTLAKQVPQSFTASSNADVVEIFETWTHQHASGVFWYRFKNDKLGAITRSVSIRASEAKNVRSLVGTIVDDLKAGFEKLPDEEILSSTGTRNDVVIAQLWENKQAHLRLYFVATEREVTLIIFDPTRFARANFFVDSSKLNEFDRKSAEIRMSLPNSDKASPRPIVDFLRGFDSR